jgi:hypothetical protein
MRTASLLMRVKQPVQRPVGGYPTEKDFRSVPDMLMKAEPSAQKSKVIINISIHVIKIKPLDAGCRFKKAEIN